MLDEFLNEKVVIDLRGEYVCLGTLKRVEEHMADATLFVPQLVRTMDEAGVTYSPSEDVRYSRSYANGLGAANGVGDTRSSNGALYGRAGWIPWSLHEKQSQIRQLQADGQIPDRVFAATYRPRKRCDCPPGNRPARRFSSSGSHGPSERHRPV